MRHVYPEDLTGIFEKEYEKERRLYQDLANHLVASLTRLAEDKAIAVIAITGRAKTIQSAVEKIVRKNYTQPFIDLTDLTGVRVVTVFESDIERFMREFQKRYEKILAVRSEDAGFKRDAMASDQFGYQSYHAVFEVARDLEQWTEWSRYSGLCAELQVRSVLQAGWAEVSHKIAYKGGVAPPKHIERRLNAISALLEIADDTFDLLNTEIRSTSDHYCKELKKGNLELPVSDLSVRFYLEVAEVAGTDAPLMERLKQLGTEAGMLGWPLQKLDSASIGRLTLTLRYLGIETIRELDDLVRRKIETARRDLKKFVAAVSRRGGVFRADGVDILTVLVSIWSASGTEQLLPPGYDWSGKFLSVPTEAVLGALRELSGLTHENADSHPSYDVVGDVHGMISTLREMLGRLGFGLEGGRWHHPEGRVVIFTGDILDRGPDPFGCLELISRMVDDGCAFMVLGNHEVNVLQYIEGYREPTPRNREQLEATLRQIQSDGDRWEAARKFLSRCPTRLELDQGRLRVIHACWEPAQISRLPEYLDTPELLQRTAKGGDLQQALDDCLKGPEEPSDPFVDKDGVPRTSQRIAWWNDYPTESPMIVFGHYWFPWPDRDDAPADPILLGHGKNAVCVDFSVGIGGRLVAFRYPERSFESVPCRDLSL